MKQRHKSFNLTRLYSFSSFYRDIINPNSMSICRESIELLLGGDSLPNKIRFTFAAKNPKMKGFIRVKYLDYKVEIKNQEFAILPYHQRVFTELNIQDGDFFWVRVETV